MQTYDAVQTETKAKEILKEKGATFFKDGSCNCECGETLCVIGVDDDYNYIGFVAVCEGCGSDNAFHDEVFNRR